MRGMVVVRDPERAQAASQDGVTSATRRLPFAWASVSLPGRRVPDLAPGGQGRRHSEAPPKAPGPCTAEAGQQDTHPMPGAGNAPSRSQDVCWRFNLLLLDIQ